MSTRALQALPALAVVTVLVVGGPVLLLREPAYGVVPVRGVGGLTVGGEAGAPAPVFDIDGLAPGQLLRQTFVVTRTARPTAATLQLDAVDLVDDEGACPEPEGECEGPGELSRQLVVRVERAPVLPTGCGAVQLAGEVLLHRLAARPLRVADLGGVSVEERVCVLITLVVPDRPDNDLVQGDRVAFGLRFTASGTGGPR